MPFPQHIIDFSINKGTGFTGLCTGRHLLLPDALCAIIALYGHHPVKGHLGLRIKPNHPKGTGHGTHGAVDAFFLINQNRIRVFIPEYGPGGTGRKAGRGITVPAPIGKGLLIMGDVHKYPCPWHGGFIYGAENIITLGMHQGTGKIAVFTSHTFFRIKDN
jgi:hypothetical protein